MNGLVENAKGIVSVTRDGLITLILLLLLLIPATINKSLVQAGFKKGSIAGFEWEAIRDNVEDNNKKLSEAATTIETLQGQLTKTEAALQESEAARVKLADQVTEDMPGTEAASLATAAPVPEAKQIAAQNREVLTKSTARSNVFRQQIQLNRDLLATVTPSGN